MLFVIHYLSLYLRITRWIDWCTYLVLLVFLLFVGKLRYNIADTEWQDWTNTILYRGICFKQSAFLATLEQYKQFWYRNDKHQGLSTSVISHHESQLAGPFDLPYCSVQSCVVNSQLSNELYMYSYLHWSLHQSDSGLSKTSKYRPWKFYTTARLTVVL